MIKRISSIIKAKANAVLDDMENPEEALKFSIVEMREQVNKIKRSHVDVAAIKKNLESELSDIESKIRISGEQAELSIASNREDLAEVVLRIDNLMKYASTCTRQRDYNEAKEGLTKAKSRIDMLKDEGVDTEYLEYLYEGIAKKAKI
jgi:phage shock protein A